MSEQLILRCEDTLDGIFTAIYDAFVYKNKMEQPYEDTISIMIGEEGNFTLFTREIEVETDANKAAKTIETIQKRLGFSVYETLLCALCHFDEDRATVVLGYLVRGFRAGTRIQEHLADYYVMRVLELSRKVNNEQDKMRGFLRFQDAGGILVAKIEPKCNVIPVMMEHFRDRYPAENFIIYDEKRKYAVVHPAHRECFFVTGQELNLDGMVSNDYFESLWKQYFDTMGIKERKNERCQNTLLPKWYRKNMTEFSNC